MSTVSVHVPYNSSLKWNEWRIGHPDPETVIGQGLRPPYQN